MHERAFAVLKKARKPMSAKEIATAIGSDNPTSVGVMLAQFTVDKKYFRRASPGMYEALPEAPSAKVPSDKPPPAGKVNGHNPQPWGVGYRCPDCYEERSLRQQFNLFECK